MLNFKTLSSCFLSSLLLASIVSTFTCFALVGCNPSNKPKPAEGFVEVTDLFLKKYRGVYIQESLGNLSIQEEVRTSDEATAEKPQSIRDIYNIEVRQFIESKSIDWNQILSDTSYLKIYFNTLPEDQKSFILSQSAFVCVQKSAGRIYSIIENFQKDFRSDKFPYVPYPELKEKILTLHQQNPERRYYMIISEIPAQTELFLVPSVVSKNIEIPNLKSSTLQKSRNFSSFIFNLNSWFCHQKTNLSKKDPAWEVIPVQTSTDENGKNVLQLEITTQDSQILFHKDTSQNKLNDQENTSQANTSKLKFHQIKE
jgi:hypothetical protein